MYMKWWTGNLYKRSIILLLSLCLVFVSGCSLLPAEEEEEVLPEINPPQISKKPEYAVTTDTIVNKVQVLGKLISLEEESLFFTLDGKHLKELYVKAGDTVEAGQVIGELDVDDLQKSLRLERLSFKSEETAMKETLRQRDELDPVEFEQRTIAFEEKRQKLADMEEEIGKAQIYAPFSGTIVTLNVKKGDLIKSYSQIGIIANTSEIVPAAKLTKTELEKIAQGMEVQVTISNVGTFTGKVKQLPVQSTESSGGGGNPGEGAGLEKPEDFLIADIEGLPAELTRGTPISLSIITKKTENAIVIPPSTLRTIGSRTYVQVVDENGKREVDVEVGQQTPTQIEILQGLKPGQKVVGR